MDAMSAESTLPGAETPSCVVCGGTDFVPHFGGSAGGAVAGAAAGGYRITHSQRQFIGALIRCRGCGMVVLPQPWSSLTAYEEGEDPYYTEQAAERIANAHDLLSLVPSGGELLEIGCACGFLLVAARERGFRVAGVEVSAWAAEYAQREYGLPVQTGWVESLALPAEYYDVVVMADTIEHLRDPRATVRRIREVLKPGGRLLLLTPDIGSMVARVAGQRWWALIDDHYFYFSRATLRRLLREEGYEVERMLAFGRRFPLSHWVLKLSQYSKTVSRTLIWVTRGLHLGRIPVPINIGDQMACVARKRGSDEHK